MYLINISKRQFAKVDLAKSLPVFAKLHRDNFLLYSKSK